MSFTSQSSGVLALEMRSLLLLTRRLSPQNATDKLNSRFWKQASTKRRLETGTIALFSDGIKRIKMRRGSGRCSSVADLRPNIFVVEKFCYNL